MNIRTKLLLTGVLVTGAMTLSSYSVMAQGMMEDQPAATEVAIKGFCPVCVLNGMKVQGKDNFTSEYKGKIYKFPALAQQKLFVNDPDKYVADLDAKFAALKDDGMMKKEGGMMEGSH